MSDDDRKPGQEDDADEATELRGKREPADDDRTELRGGAEAPDASEDEEEETILRARQRAPQDVDDEEPTEFRGAPGGREAPAAPTADAPAPGDQEDATELRGGRKDLSATTVRPGSPVEREDATELRGGREDLSATTVRPGSPVEREDATELRSRADDDSTEINSLTQSMPTVGRASLGPAPDAPRLKKNAGASGAEESETDATYLRGTPGATESDATRLRAGALPSDDDETVVGAELDDEDATVQALGIPPADEDATVQAAGGRAGLQDDDATMQAGRDDDPTVQGGTASRVAAPSRPHSPQSIGPGTVLKGRFTLEDKLGAGGMGGVFKAVDLVKKEARDRFPYVAVKVLNEAFAEHEDSFLALQRESSRSQRLTHPNIAAVYDFDRDGDTAYMIMELLEGSPLDSYLKKNKQGLDPEQARDVIRDISGALAYAHTQTPALVHSDFKPGNIFYTDDGAAKVFDFGIARAATETSDDVIKNEGMDVDALEVDSEDGTLFDAGKLGALTPAYAAIEMFEGRDPAPQDDVYALGIVAYQCITGKHPFNRQKAPVAAAQGMVPERPPGVTNREWKAIKRALEFKREDRTPDAQAFLDEFFYTGTKTLLAVAATAATMAIGVGALYFAGVIGPQAPTADPNEDWVALESEINVPRSTVRESLADGMSDGFTTNDEFVAWEGVVRRNIDAWSDVDAPVIELARSFDSEAAALAEQDRIFQLSGATLSLAVRSSGAAGPWRLAAGPFRYVTRAEIDAAGDPAYTNRLGFQEFRAELEALGIDHDVRTDDAAIGQARDEALTVYLAEFERRLPDTAPPDVRPVVRKGEAYLSNVNPDPTDETTRAHLVEGGFWVVDQDAQQRIAGVRSRIRAAGLDETDPTSPLYEQDRDRGPSVLARAETYFPTRPADIAAARRRGAAVYDDWGRPVENAQRLASQYQSRYISSLQTFADQQARENERQAVANARREGGTVEIALTRAEFEPQLDAARIVEEFTNADGNAALRVRFPGVFEVFSRECNAPARVDSALVDYPYLPEARQRSALRILADCMRAKLESDADNVLESKQILLASIDYQPIALIERPDPCGAAGYVGAGRNAFCRDTWSGGAAPPVVIIDGPGSAPNYGIGKYEVSIADYNAFAEATRRETLAGPSRIPATGVSLDDARAYTAWLSRRTDRTYRLPSVAEWRHAASANDDVLDANRNCYSNVRGVIRGDTLVNVGQGAPNAWGLVNHVGNVEEWAVSDDGVELVGGRHTDPIAECTVARTREDSGAPDGAKGFRVLREIDGIGRGDAALASAGGN